MIKISIADESQIADLLSPEDYKELIIGLLSMDLILIVLIQITILLSYQLRKLNHNLSQELYTE